MKRPIETGGKEKPKRAAIYLRVSTVYQVDKDSLPMQRQELIGYCEYVLGIKDYIIFEDAGYSGKNTDRPDYQKMMAQIRQGLFTHLVVWKIDRISRNLLDFAQMYDELKKLEVTFVSKNEQFNTSNAMGEAMLKIILVFAELERGMTSERVTATMINRASNGIWNGGRVPFGYDYNKEAQTFSVNEDEAHTVLKMFDLYEGNGSLVHTSRQLNDDGLRSRNGSQFSPVSVWTILRNPWYRGVYRYNYYKIPGRKAIKDESEWVIVENHHPALVSEERFDKVQAMLTTNARYRNTPGRKAVQKNVNIFSGLIWCACCGAAFTASPGRLHVSGYRPTKYGCPNVRRSGTCDAKFTTDTVLGEFLINLILNIMRAQKGFENIQTPDDLRARLLRGRAFADVSEIGQDGLLSLFEMLSNFSPADSVLLAKPKVKEKIDPELRRLKNDKKKQERALERLNHIYLYSENPMSDREYILQKQGIIDSLQEINEAIGLASKESWVQTLSDDDFIEQASTFILNQRLQEREYICFENLAEDIDPAILKTFFLSILDSVRLRRGRPETVTFKNGLSLTFDYHL